MKISKIILYDEPLVQEIQLEKIVKRIQKIFPVEFKIEGNFFQGTNEKVHEKMERVKIFDLKKPFEKQITKDTKSKIVKENNSNKKEDLLYDGFEFHRIIRDIITKKDNREDALHIIFTNKTICTFDENDFRYHARVLISSNPTIISTTGMIEAPAKPKQYYLDLITNFSNKKLEEISEKYIGEYLEYHDPRLSEIAEGCILQAIMYYETGEAFCEHKSCRLFNAHWQKDMIYSQIENKKFCRKHLEIIKELKNQI